MSRPFVYIASPYTKGDPAINTYFQCQVFDRLMNDGRVHAYIPLWSHYQHGVAPRPYKDWIEYDKDAIRQLGIVACLRLNAEVPKLGYKVCESSGADGEVALFKELGRPVFYSIEELYAFLDSGKTLDDTAELMRVGREFMAWAAQRGVTPDQVLAANTVKKLSAEVGQAIMTGRSII